MKRLAIGLILGLGCALVACKDRAPSKSKKSSPKRATPKDTVPKKVVPQVLWRTPYKGRLRTLVVSGSALLVASRGRGDRATARRVAGFSRADGKLLWEKVIRVRFYERSVPWSASIAQVGGVLAVAKSAHRVAGLDPATGARKWQVRATGGVVAAGAHFAVAHHGEVRLLKPADGTEVLRMSLADPRSGAPGNGVAAELRPGTLLVGDGRGLLLTRRGGALQSLHAKTLVKRWLFEVPGALPKRPDRHALSADTVLVPVLRPPRQDWSTLRAWPAFGPAAKPQWTARVPGRISRRLTFVTSTHVLGVSRSRTQQSLLWRVDRKTGQLVDARPVPRPHFCYLGGTAPASVLVCKRRAGVSAHAVDTLKRSWHYPAPRGRNIRSLRVADGLVVMEVGRKLVVLGLADGRTRFSVVRRLKKHDYRVIRLLGVSGGRLLLAARRLEGKTYGDLLLLLGLALEGGAVTLEKRLGRYPGVGDPVWPGAPEKLPGTLPVILVRAGHGQPDRVFSIFDKSFQVLDARTGRSLFARGIPPQADREVRLLRVDRDFAVYRRGNGLFGIDLKKNRLAWRASLWKAPLVRAFGHRAYLRGDKDRLAPRPKQAPDPDRQAVATAAQEKCRLRYAEPDRWFCQNDKSLLVIRQKGGQVAARLGRAHNIFRTGGLVLASHAASEKTTEPDLWVALDRQTGKRRWTQEAATDRGARSPLPVPFDRERPDPAQWTWAGLGLFLVTSADGRCVHAVHQHTGKAAFKRCFGALDGPPLVADQRLLIAARPATAQGSKPAAEQKLYLLDPKTGQARVVFDPGPGQRIVLGMARVTGGVLYATLRPTSGVTRANQVIALRLYAKK